MAVVFCAVLIFVEFSVIKLIVEHEIIRYNLIWKPHGFFKDFLIFSFLSAAIFFVINRARGESFPLLLTLSLPALLSHLSSLLLFISCTHFMTHRLAVFQTRPAFFTFLWSFFGLLAASSGTAIGLDFGQLFKLLAQYKKLWAICGIFSFLFLYLTPTLESYWQPLSLAIGRLSEFLLSLTYSGAFFTPDTFFLGVREFAVTIYKPCSGIEGIRLFIFLFTIVVITDWHRISKLRAILIYFIGSLIMFMADVVRVYFIVLLGYEVYKRWGHAMAYRIVLEHFHSNFGWVLYITVILLLFKIFYPFLIRLSSKEKDSVSHES